jgi:hypothetical protein
VSDGVGGGVVGVDCAVFVGVGVGVGVAGSGGDEVVVPGGVDGLGLGVVVNGGLLDGVVVGSGSVLVGVGLGLLAEVGGFDVPDWLGAGVVGWLAAGEVGWEVAVSPGIGVLSFWTLPWSLAGGAIEPGVSGIFTVALLYDCIHRSTVDT